MVCLLFVTCILFFYNLLLSIIILICPTEYKSSIEFLSTLVNMGILTPIFSLRLLSSLLYGFKLPNFSLKIPDLSQFKFTQYLPLFDFKFEQLSKCLSSSNFKFELLLKYLPSFEFKPELLLKYLPSFEIKLKSLSNYLSSFDYKPFGPYLKLFGSEPQFDYIGANHEGNSTSSESSVIAIFKMRGNESGNGNNNSGGKLPFARTSSSPSGKVSSTNGSIHVKIRLNVKLGAGVWTKQELLSSFSK
jgi:hypothetical protein